MFKVRELYYLICSGMFWLTQEFPFWVFFILKTRCHERAKTDVLGGVFLNEKKAPSFHWIQFHKKHKFLFASKKLQDLQPSLFDLGTVLEREVIVRRPGHLPIEKGFKVEIAGFLSCFVSCGRQLLGWWKKYEVDRGLFEEFTRLLWLKKWWLLRKHQQVFTAFQGELGWLAKTDLSMPGLTLESCPLLREKQPCGICRRISSAPSLGKTGATYLLTQVTPVLPTGGGKGVVSRRSRFSHFISKNIND